MCKTKICPIGILSALIFAGGAFGQVSDRDPHNQPSVFLDNKGKPLKPSQARTIDGVVRDHADNPIAGAIVSLKDLKTSKVIDFATKDDGKFVFRELSMNINYELTAKHEGLSSVKKVSPFDTRNEVILTFHLEPPEAPEAGAAEPAAPKSAAKKQQ